MDNYHIIRLIIANTIILSMKTFSQLLSKITLLYCLLVHTHIASHYLYIVLLPNLLDSSCNTYQYNSNLV